MSLHHNRVKAIARNNGILFIAIIILSFIAWFQPGLHPVVHQYLSTLKAKKINTIILERQDIGSIKLQKQTNGWFLQEPYQLPANSLRVNTITSLAEKRSYSQFESTENDLNRYHLDKPFVSVWLDETKLILGSEDPINRQRYAMNISDNILTGNNTVHLINGVIFYQLRANLDTFISPTFLPPQASLKNITWLDKELSIKKGRWELKTDSLDNAPNASSDSIAQLIQYWQHGRAKKVETNITLSISNEELMNSPGITISFIPFGEKNATASKIHYLIIQDDKQIKLLRTDIQIAYWISSQMLKQLTEFLPIPTNPKN
ncbi:MAG: DUF4340 domain-containing protein [Gammaproteobacteria bacterium]|nr:DUF4340 domain-containing protein [Gammaproteobacteria bacterium]